MGEIGTLEGHGKEQQKDSLFLGLIGGISNISKGLVSKGSAKESIRKNQEGNEEKKK